MTTDNKERDFENVAGTRFPGRFDPRLLNNTADVGDGFPGLQRLFRNYLHEGYIEKDLDLVGSGIKGTSVNINNVELQQLSNIGAVTISSAQWGYIGGADQPVKQADSPTFGGLNINGSIVITANVDGVDVSDHTHGGAGQGGTVAFASLSGDIVYSQLDSIVDISGVGSANLISGAQHKHTDADGSSKITHVNTTGRTASDHHAKYTDASALAQAKTGISGENVMHGNDTERSNPGISGIIKRTLIYENIDDCKITFDYMCTNLGGGITDFWLEIDGIREGDKVAATENYQTCTRDNITFEKGQYIRVNWSEVVSDGQTNWCRNFRIKSDLFTNNDP